MFGTPEEDNGYRADVDGFTVEAVAEDFDVSEEKARSVLHNLEEENIMRYNPTDEVWRLGSTMSATKFLVKNREHL